MSEPTHSMVTRFGTLRPISVTEIDRGGRVTYRGLDGQVRYTGIGNLRPLSACDTALKDRAAEVRKNYHITLEANMGHIKRYTVTHPTDPTRSYRVITSPLQDLCTCQAFKGKTCKHILAIKGE